MLNNLFLGRCKNYLQNLSPKKSNEYHKTPYELWYGSLLGLFILRFLNEKSMHYSLKKKNLILIPYSVFSLSTTKNQRLVILWHIKAKNLLLQKTFLNEMHNKSIDNFTISYHETCLLVYIDFLELFLVENSQMHPKKSIF